MSTTSLEKLTNATMKNRIQSSQMISEMNRIEKEKQNELRMINNEKQRFHAKYSKMSGLFDGNDVSDVKMYETHNPGFCFRRNGEHRVQQPPPAKPSIDFKHLLFLLFTDGEVDIDKVLCLHLLSFHETADLSPPKQLKNTNVYLKRDSPVEQLIERSRETNRELAKIAALPIYILDLPYDSDDENEPKLFDKRLRHRLLVNEQILSLIQTVVETLRVANSEKYDLLTEMAGDVSAIRRTFAKPHIQDFIMALKDHTLLHSCSCFILAQATRDLHTHLEIRTVTGCLEDLIGSIRLNVLQLSNRHRYRSFGTVDTDLVNESEESLEGVERSKERVRTRVAKSQANDKVVVFGRRRRNNESLSFDEEEEDENVNFRRSNVNYIARNIESVGSLKKRLQEKSAVSILKRDMSGKSFASSTLKFQSGQNSPISDISKTSLKKSLIRLADTLPAPPSVPNHSCIRVHLKQTTCLACMEKWKQPLPIPKVSSINRNRALTASVAQQPSTNELNSLQRLGMLIEREEYRLKSYDRKYASDTSANSVYLINKRKNFKKKTDMYDLSMTVYHLEKIRQEIREKETQKKLDRFLMAD